MPETTVANENVAAALRAAAASSENKMIADLRVVQVAKAILSK